MVRLDVNLINELIESSNEVELEKQINHLSSMDTKSRIVGIIDIIDEMKMYLPEEEWWVIPSNDLFPIY